MTHYFKTNMAWSVYGLLIGAAVTTILFLSNLRGTLVHEHLSPYDSQATLQTIQDNAVKHGWKVAGVGDYHMMLAKAGEPPLPELHVLEIYHPEYATKMLLTGSGGSLAVMPFTLTVYDRDGKTYVAHINRGLISRYFRHQAGGVGVTANVRIDERDILDFLLKPAPKNLSAR